MAVARPWPGVGVMLLLESQKEDGGRFLSEGHGKTAGHEYNIYHGRGQGEEDTSIASPYPSKENNLSRRVNAL